jgi:hypothetical protein
MAQMLAPEVIRTLEFLEIDALLAMARVAPPAAVTKLGTHSEQVGSARVLMTEQVEAILFNRVVGLGLAEPATEAMVDRILTLYQQAGISQFAIQLSPTAQPAELLDWLLARGFQHSDNWAKCLCEAAPSSAISTELRIVEIGREQAATFAELACRIFQFPRLLASLLAVSVGQAGWHHYLALDGQTPVATGALFVQDKVGWLGIGGTLRSYRRRGAQGALLTRRIHDALALGCRLLVTETGEDVPAHPNPSYHNMLRTGFRLAYVRPNYIFGLKGVAAA